MAERLCLLLSFALLALTTCSMAQTRDDSRWINQLKNTQVSQIEEGLDSSSFGDWFAELVKPSQTGYEVKECGPDGPGAGKNHPRMLCVVAYTQPEPLRRIQLTFVVGAFLAEKEKERAEVKPVPCRFLSGIEGPADPRMKRPTRLISKLSELQKLLRGSHSGAQPPSAV